MKWSEVAKVVENDFGMQVDWEERFFICPECDEPIYEEDWDKDAILESGYCPVCVAALIEECKYENFYEHEHEDEEYDEDEMMYARYEGEDTYEK